MCMRLYTYVCKYLQRSDEGVRTPGAGVKGEPPVRELGTELQFSTGETDTFNCCLSSALELLFLPVPYMLGLQCLWGYRCRVGAGDAVQPQHPVLVHMRPWIPFPAWGRREDKEHVHCLASVVRLWAQWGVSVVYKDLTVPPALKWRQAFRWLHTVPPRKWPRCPLLTLAIDFGC